MKQLYFIFISLMVFLPSLALSQVRIHLPGEKLGELDFGVLHRGQVEMRTATFVNQSAQDIVVPLIEVTGPGYRLMGRSFAYVGARSTGDFLIRFTADPNLPAGIYLGKCVIYIKHPNGSHYPYEYDLKVQVVD